MGKAGKKEAFRKIGKSDNASFAEGASSLAQKRDVLLQEVLEVKNRLAIMDAEREEMRKKLEHKLSQIILCEKMIETFGKRAN